MTDRIVFSRIIIDNKIIAALNFSRMIPVETNQLSRIDIKVRKHDNPQVVKRKHSTGRNFSGVMRIMTKYSTKPTFFTANTYLGNISNVKKIV